MKRSTNTLAIGLFVLGAAVILIVAAVFIKQGGFGTAREKGVLVFTGNVKGLRLGAPVAFKGVQIGQVTRINLIIDTDTYDVMMPVEIEFNERRIRKIGDNMEDDNLERLIERGMRGQLQVQSLLTGLLYVQLDFHPGTKVEYSDIQSDLVEIPTIATDMEKFSKALEDLDIKILITNLQSTIAGIDKLVNDPELIAVAGNLNQSLAAVEQLSQTLEREIKQVSPGINLLVGHTDIAVQAFNNELPELADSTKLTLAEIKTAVGTFEQTMTTVDYTLSDDSATMVNIQNAARELAAAGRSLQALAESLERQPESLLRGRSKQEN